MRALNEGYVIKIDDALFAANYSGLGQVTHNTKDARIYTTERGAKIGLSRLRRYRPYPLAKIEPAGKL